MNSTAHFCTWKPDLAVITSMDADHLDIYGSHEKVIESFHLFAANIRKGGSLLYKKGLDFETTKAAQYSKFSYSITEDADY